jgi:hypothetical protein
MKKIYIYKLIDPITNEIRYVGKTTNIARRLQAHITRSKNNKYHTACWVQSLVKRGLRPLIEKIEECTEDNWQERERYWIKEYRKIYNLTNTLDGGEGCATYGRLGKPWTDEHRVNNRKSRLGVSVKHTPKGNANRKKGVRKYFDSIKKCVLQYDLNGNFIKKWASAVDAANELGLNHSNITRACKKSNTTSNGFMWAYEDIKVSKHEKTKHSEKSVLQFTKCGKLLCEYDSLTCAYNKTGVRITNISNCLTNRSKTAGGYQWKYKN